MHIILILVGLVIELTESIKGSNDYSYDYSEPEIKDLKQIAGKRLINARAADANEFQFVGALYMTSSKKIVSPTCTSSLISPDFALRSADCRKTGKKQVNIYQNPWSMNYANVKHSHFFYQFNSHCV